MVRITVTDVITGETKTRRIVTRTETTTGRTVGVVAVVVVTVPTGETAATATITGGVITATTTGRKLSGQLDTTTK